MDGERTTEQPGDFIITPSWTFHDHGHSGVEGVDAPVVWLDAQAAPFGQTSPIFSYPYARTREALHHLEQHADINA